MLIEFNGESREVSEPISIGDLLEQANVRSQLCAVELNEEILPKQQYDSTQLREGDRVEVVTLVGGG